MTLPSDEERYASSPGRQREAEQSGRLSGFKVTGCAGCQDPDYNHAEGCTKVHGATGACADGTCGHESPLKEWREDDPCPVCHRQVWTVALGSRCECNGTRLRNRVVELTAERDALRGTWQALISELAMRMDNREIPERAQRAYRTAHGYATGLLASVPGIVKEALNGE